MIATFHSTLAKSRSRSTWWAGWLHCVFVYFQSIRSRGRGGVGMKGRAHAAFCCFSRILKCPPLPPGLPVVLCLRAGDNILQLPFTSTSPYPFPPPSLLYVDIHFSHTPSKKYRNLFVCTSRETIKMDEFLCLHLLSKG